MPEVSSSTAPRSTGGKNSAALTAARESRKARSLVLENAGPETQFAYKTVLQAQRACDLIKTRLTTGKQVHPAVIAACASLVSTFSAPPRDQQ